MKRVLLFLAMAMVPVALRAQTVTHHPQPSEMLGQKWAWAVEQARQPAYRDGYWIGYSIERLMGERSFVGSWLNRERTTLHELIYGEKAEYDYRVLGKRSRDEKSERKVVKDMALLFAFKPGSTQPVEVCVSNLSGHVDLEGQPLLWLGSASNTESLDLIAQQYERATSVDVREDLVMTVGIHQEEDRVVGMLSDILTGKDDTDVREQAAFWLGQQNDPDGLTLLVRTARTDRSEDVREQAVFGISQTDLPAATEALIDLARNAQGEVRKDAIFWLGQKASKRAVEALGDMVEDDDADTDVQKQAVFAISQLSDDEAVPLLIKIARTHARAAVRKQAIFWLGQSDDPRALEALVALARG